MRRAFFGCVLAVLATTGCKDFFDGGDPPPTARNGLGEACSDTDDCRVGLVCEDLVCAASGSVAEGGTCTLTGDCMDGLYCAADRTCSPAGTADVDEACSSTGDCIAGLTCVVRGFYAECTQPGGGDVGTSCMSAQDCAPGLSCLPTDPMNPQCGSAPPAEPGTVLPPSFPTWAGVECPADEGSPRAYFEIPRFDGSDNDFYRLPFPNDVRRTPMGIDLRNHPTPDTAVDVDIIDRYLRAAEEDMNGFAHNPTVYFRFSSAYDWDTVGESIVFVNVDPDSPGYGNEVSYAWLTTFGPITKYICENWVGIRTGHGSPLDPDTTYAVVLKNGLRPHTDVGGSFGRDADFDAMLDPARPGDPLLALAWDDYQPLRDWLADPDTTLASSAEVLTATVFTTQSRFDMTALREVIHEGALANVTDLTVCGPGVTSPCDDGTPSRSCEGGSTAYTEIHGRIALPIFQQGTPPYLEPEDGGGVSYDAGGRPQVARTENVCFAMTIPTVGTMPAEGWPVVFAMHGTGGSFRTAVSNGGAEAMATGDLGPSALPTATFAIDLPQHGERRNSDRSADVLFFNFLNPRAAWGNSLQGAADMFAAVRWLVEGTVDSATSPTGETIAFDPARIATFTHSQGSNHADLALPYEPDVLAAILSGSSGDLTLSLLNKESPVNIAAVVPFALLDANGEGKLTAGDFHPVLALWQGYFDTVDPVNYGRLLSRERVAGVPVKHVFMTYGIGDTFSPEPNMEAYARAAGFPHVTPHADPDLRLTSVDPPLMGNVPADDSTYTHALRSYAPTGGEDGHFVATRTDAGRVDTRSFLLQALSGAVPTVE